MRDEKAGRRRQKEKTSKRGRERENSSFIRKLLGLLLLNPLKSERECN